MGDPEVDDDGGDGREDITSEDEESEIETESEDEMDVDESEESEEGPRHGPVLGERRSGRKEKRGQNRSHPYR